MAIHGIAINAIQYLLFIIIFFFGESNSVSYTRRKFAFQLHVLKINFEEMV